jgi:uncharacterized protein YndB with AHSA1/START domain
MPEQAMETMVLRKSVAVNAPVEEAFRIYTDGIATWWPLATHSVSGDRAETAVFEGRVGGRIFEREPDGTEHLWGTVLEWDPPHGFVHTWHPGRGEETAQRVAMRFVPDGDGTRLELEHRGWENLGADAESTYANYDGGWDFVLGERYVAVATGIRGAGT